MTGTRSRTPGLTSPPPAGVSINIGTIKAAHALQYATVADTQEKRWKWEIWLAVGGRWWVLGA